MIGTPHLQQRDEVTVRVGELRVFSVRSGLGILRSFTRILHGQHRRQHQHLAQCCAPLRLDQHAPQPRVHWQTGELTPQRCDLPVFVHRLQLLQQTIAIVDLASIGRVNEREGLRCPKPQRLHLQDDASQVRPQHLRRRERVPQVEIVFAVQTHAKPGPDASATPPPLSGTCLGNWLHRQALDFGAGAVPTDARRTHVDDAANARNRQRCLSHVRRQHHPLPAATFEHLLLVFPAQA